MGIGLQPSEVQILPLSPFSCVEFDDIDAASFVGADTRNEMKTVAIIAIIAVLVIVWKDTGPMHPPEDVE